MKGGWRVDECWGKIYKYEYTKVCSYGMGVVSG